MSGLFASDLSISILEKRADFTLPLTRRLTQPRIWTSVITCESLFREKLSGRRDTQFSSTRTPYPAQSYTLSEVYPTLSFSSREQSQFYTRDLIPTEYLIILAANLTC